MIESDPEVTGRQGEQEFPGSLKDPLSRLEATYRQHVVGARDPEATKGELKELLLGHHWAPTGRR